MKIVAVSLPLEKEKFHLELYDGEEVRGLKDPDSILVSKRTDDLCKVMEPKKVVLQVVPLGFDFGLGVYKSIGWTSKGVLIQWVSSQKDEGDLLQLPA